MPVPRSCDTRWMQAVGVDGLRMTYQRVGRAKTVVLVHGYVGDGLSTGRSQLEGLSHEFDVIAWDLPGAGGSDGSTGVLWYVRLRGLPGRVDHHAQGSVSAPRRSVLRWRDGDRVARWKSSDETSCSRPATAREHPTRADAVVAIARPTA